MSSEAPIADMLAEWAHGVEYGALPQEVIQSVRDRLTDIIGVAIAGRNSDAGLIVRVKAHDWGGPGESSIIGESSRIRTAYAALTNGTYAHALDFDDTHLPSIVHPSAPIIPAALAVAEVVGASGQDLIAALSVAYEVSCRLGLAQYNETARESTFIARGFHVSSFMGAIAAATACAKLLGADTDQLRNAITVSSSMGAGLLESSRSGGSIKKFQGGWAAFCGVTAADLAMAGLTGAPTALEGRYGLFRATCGTEWDATALLQELGKRWHAPTIMIKPYPCTHLTHALVDAALAFRRRGILPDDVQSIDIGVASSVVPLIGEPVETKRRPPSPYLAQFSGPFVFASAFAGGGGLGVSVEDFTAQRLTDPVRSRLAEACTVAADPECDRIFPQQFPARVRITLNDGAIVEEMVATNRGGLDNPLSPAELSLKLSQTAGACAPALTLAIAHLDQASDISELMAATVDPAV